MTRIYYNEIDKVAAQWLRNLIDAGHIAPGDVDERSIEDVEPVELAGYTQCHFFAGIGIWSYSLRRAGWPDDRPVWTGSCPCQPFSPAGKGDGFDDERHLWPAFDWLIGQCRPPTVLGEQVDGTDGMVWNDLVSTDLEEKGYAFGAAIIPAAGFAVDYLKTVYAKWLERAIHDCPDPVVAGVLRDFAGWAGGNLGVGGAHIRHRQYWVAQRMADANGRDASAGRQQGWQGISTARHRGSVEPAGSVGGMDNSVRQGLEGHTGDGNRSAEPGRDSADQDGSIAASSGAGNTDATDIERRVADWLYCRDGCWRPVGPGTFPLADDATARVGRLRAYGNGLDAETATGFIKAVMDLVD